MKIFLIIIGVVFLLWLIWAVCIYLFINQFFSEKKWLIKIAKKKK